MIGMLVVVRPWRRICFVIIGSRIFDISIIRESGITVDPVIHRTFGINVSIVDRSWGIVFATTTVGTRKKASGHGKL